MIRHTPDAHADVQTDDARTRVVAGHSMLHRLAFAVLVTLLASSMGCRERNGADGASSAAAVPAANFVVDVTGGAAPLAVQFTDTSAGNVATYAWEFSDGQTADVPSPNVTFASIGTFDVKLTVTGPNGTSVREVTSLIEVADPPTAGFTCDTSAGPAPLSVTCTTNAVGATTTTWTFTNTSNSDTVVSNDANATVSLATGGDWTVRQDVSNVAGTDAFTQAAVIDVDGLTVGVSPLFTAGPGLATLSADTEGRGGVGTWFVDGAIVADFLVSGSAGSANAEYRFPSPGTYEVTFQFGTISPPAIQSETFQYVVPYAVPSAGFAAGTPVGPGPLTVVFENQSVGEVTSARWTFGDGEVCDFPGPIAAGATSVCDAFNPSHTYAAVGRYDVTLDITGPAADPAAADEADSVAQADAVTVTIVDPGFEAQTTASEIDGGWTAIRPAGATATAQHIALSQTQAAGADAGMPSEGDKWAALDGLGTDGSTPALSVENGIRTTLLLPTDRPVLEFDYALLFSEPPVGIARDAMTATVSDGVTTVEMTSAAADTRSAYDGGSTRYPTLDGSTTRVTPIRVASLDVATAFPTATADTEFTLTIRLTNDVNAFRPPRAYVDGVRFVARANEAIAAGFTAPATIVAGEAVDFIDTTCPTPSAGVCETPSSWRWDFGTRESIVPPASTGSALQDPTYVFDTAGDYEVTLWARNAERADEAVLNVSVLEAPVSIPVEVSVTPGAGFWDVDMRSDSTADPDDDSIVAWSWDFEGFALSSDEDPAPVRITQGGTLQVRLTITTARGLEATATVDVELD